MNRCYSNNLLIHSMGTKCTVHEEMEFPHFLGNLPVIASTFPKDDIKPVHETFSSGILLFRRAEHDFLIWAFRKFPSTVLFRLPVRGNPEIQTRRMSIQNFNYSSANSQMKQVLLRNVRCAELFMWALRPSVVWISEPRYNRKDNELFANKKWTCIISDDNPTCAFRRTRTPLSQREQITGPIMIHESETIATILFI